MTTGAVKITHEQAQEIIRANINGGLKVRETETMPMNIEFVRVCRMLKEARK